MTYRARAYLVILAGCLTFWGGVAVSAGYLLLATGLT